MNRDALLPPAIPPNLVDRGSGALVSPTYTILTDQQSLDDNSAWHAYNLLSALFTPGVGFLTGLAQYGVLSLSYAGFDIFDRAGGELAETPDGITLFLTSKPHFYDEPDFIYGKQWAAFHGYVTSPFMVVPTGLQQGMFNALDTFTQCLTHEVAETLLDSNPGNGWLFSSGDESDDIAPCAWNPYYILVNGFRYAVARYWRNDEGQCFNG